MERETERDGERDKREKEKNEQNHIDIKGRLESVSFVFADLFFLNRTRELQVGI